MKRHRIMAVDNEFDTVYLVKRTLERAGFEVLTALNGKECLSKLGNGGVDLVLLDIMMPDMSGWDVYEKIRKTNTEVRVAFLSILECSDDRKEKLKSEGVADYINKPFRPKELVKRVSAILADK